MQRVISRALTLSVILSSIFSMTVLAAESEQKYHLYQIFTGKYQTDADGNVVLSDIKWGENGSGETGTTVDIDILKDLQAVASSTSNSAKLEIIMKYALVDQTSTPMYEFSTTTLTGLEPGYYLIRDAVPRADKTVMTYVVKVTDGTLTFDPKIGVPTVTKTLTETKKQIGDYAIGETIEYTIEGTLPDNYADFRAYTYTFVDKMFEGITYNDDMSITFYEDGDTTQTGTDVTEKFTVADPTTVVDHYFKVTATCTNLKTAVPTASSASKFVITYSGKLNEKAAIGNTGNLNEVTLVFSNNPNITDDNDPGTTAETVVGEMQRVTVYTSEIAVLKVDLDNKVLKDVEFELSGDDLVQAVVGNATFVESADNADYYELKSDTFTMVAPTEKTKDQYKTETPTHKKVNASNVISTPVDKKLTAKVDENGYVVFTGLAPGTYTLHESKAIAGYNEIPDVTITIAFDETTKTFSFTGAQLLSNGVAGLVVVNQKGAMLPETGGSGVYGYYALGAGVIIIALFVLIVSKRKNAKGN